MSLVNWLPNVSTQSRVFISGNEIQGMVTYIPVGGGAGEMAMGGKYGREAKSVGGHVIDPITHFYCMTFHYIIIPYSLYCLFLF